MTTVIERASKLVTPSASEVRKLDVVNSKVRAMLEAALSGSSPSPEISLGGSYARGTWLKGSLDIDYFILYPQEFPREKLETEAVDSAKKALMGYRINLRYAEHPYVEGFVDGVRVNIVPCYKVQQGEWKSAADRSPYHTRYVAFKLDDRLRREARLFKKFVKAAGVYGAEVKVQGFSGYVCEVLVLKFGSFESTLEALATLKANQVISLEPYDEDLIALFNSPVVILDPVDTTRNLGTAISARNVAKLVIEARRFIANPSIHFFSASKLSRTPRKELAARTLVVRFKTEKRSPDILWGQLRKSAASISNKLQSMGFNVLRSTVASNDGLESAFLFLFSDLKISSVYSRVGPEYFRREEIENYFSKNRKKALATWIGEEGKLESVFSRDFVDAKNALMDMLANRLDTVGLSEEIKREIARGFRLSSGTSISKNKDWLGRTLSSLLVEE